MKNQKKLSELKFGSLTKSDLEKNCKQSCEILRIKTNASFAANVPAGSRRDPHPPTAVQTPRTSPQECFHLLRRLDRQQGRLFLQAVIYQLDPEKNLRQGICAHKKCILL
jgi:hypothetical protein